MSLPTSTSKQARCARSMLCAAALLAGTAAAVQSQQPATLDPATIIQLTPPDAALLPDEAFWTERGVLAIYFAEGRSVLTAEARRALDRAIPQLLDHLTGSGRVIVLGQFDQGDRPDETPMLAARRVEAVASYLHEGWGIDPRSLDLLHRRVRLPFLEEQDLAGLDRRVEIFLQLHPISVRRLVDESLPLRRLVSGNHLDLDDFGGAVNPLMRPYHVSRPLFDRN